MCGSVSGGGGDGASGAAGPDVVQLLNHILAGQNEERIYRKRTNQVLEGHCVEQQLAETNIQLKQKFEATGDDEESETRRAAPTYGQPEETGHDSTRAATMSNPVGRTTVPTTAGSRRQRRRLRYDCKDINNDNNKDNNNNSEHARAHSPERMSAA